MDEDESLDNDPDFNDMWRPEQNDEVERLMEIGYGQLDAFNEWLEQDYGSDVRAVNRDAFNVESFLEYLAIHGGRSVTACNEFDLRWFVFSHYPRIALADEDTGRELLSSLERFFRFLLQTEGFEAPPWVDETLDETAWYESRRKAYERIGGELDEHVWEEGYTVWCAELADDLENRCLLLPKDLGAGIRWGEATGWREGTLWREANTLWQTERQALVIEGMDSESMRPLLVSVYSEWLDTPQVRLEGLTPRDVVSDEQQSLAKPESNDCNGDDD